MAAPVDPPETPEVEATPAPQPGPWSADLAEYFGDNAEAIAAADRYMREKVQPRITQLEEGTADARALWDDINKDATGTLTEVVGELYGADVAEGFKKLFGEEGEDAPAEVVAEVAEAAGVKLPEEDRELLEWARNKRAAEAEAASQDEYQEAKNGLKEKHGLTDKDLGLIDPFIAVADSLDHAVEAYNGWKADFLAQHGVEPAAEEETTAAPPQVLGSEAAPAAAPPVVEKYATFDDAWDAWRNEEAVQPPPVVGSA